MGYHGSFWANRDTFDVLRLDIITDDIPPVLGLDQSTTTMEYKRAKIGESEFLLPSSSQLAMTHLNGDESRNRIRFSGCRQYTGESVLSFGEAPLDAKATPAPLVKTEVTIPENTLFEVAIETGVDSETSMVGDEIHATLRQDIKMSHRILMARGATLVGRIVGLEMHSEYCLLELRFSVVESGEARAMLNARIETTSMPEAYGFSRRFVRRDGAGFPPGTVAFKGSRLHIQKGLRLQLRTYAFPSASPE